MAARKPRNKEDQLFVRDGRRSYRKQYSLTEFRLGLLVLVALTLIGAWVVWRGRHPDPALFTIPLESLKGSVQVERDPLPEGLAMDGWVEGDVARFDWDNLYEKINGREGFYKSFGFQELVFVSLARADDPMVTVDIELFDQGSAANAVGTYAGERPESIQPESDDAGMWHFDRNAFYMTRGPYYIRAIGSDESPQVLQLLAHLQDTFARNMGGAEKPWAFELFVDGMHATPGDVSFVEENAFSFGFASNVWVANWQDFEVFAVPNRDDARARALAARFAAGFLDLGERATGDTDVAWVQDRYLGAISGALSQDRWVLGVRNAPDVTAAEQALTRLQAAVAGLSEAATERAWASLEEQGNREPAATGDAEVAPEGY
jgi:hypothetical protein